MHLVHASRAGVSPTDLHPTWARVSRLDGTRCEAGLNGKERETCARLERLNAQGVRTDVNVTHL